MPIENAYSPEQRAFLDRVPQNEIEKMAQVLLTGINSSTRSQAKWALLKAFKVLHEAGINEASLRDVAEAMELIPSEKLSRLQKLTGN